MPYKVLRYSIENLKKCFIEQATAHEEVVSSKQHLACFENYFSHIGVKTIIVEKDYVNREFLEDYSSYYVRSFKDYKRHCVRLHFFKIEISEEDFSLILEGTPKGICAKNLQENYQGFMVLKPLPITIIGKTCISTYEEDNKRHFPTIRKYHANLYGINLSVESLAYQEQDSIVAACASSSIWSAFHRTAILFQHSLPSPVEITKWATRHFPFANRHFPNKGLSAEQMAIAIREIGLEPLLSGVNTYDTLKATVYAYIRGKIPIVFGFDLWDVNNNSSTTPARNFGAHAITITGFNETNIISNKFETVDNLTLRSSRIDKFYTHDDQMGPFSKIEFNDFEVWNHNKGSIKCLDMTWKDINGNKGNIKAGPQIIIIPLYHKIRIPFTSVLTSINFFNNLFIPLIGRIPNFQLFEWDIFLSDISDFKSDILNDSKLESKRKKEILLTKLPKFIWRAIGRIKNENCLEFVFDATDIDQGSFFILTVNYNTNVYLQYNLLLKKYDSKNMEDFSAKSMIESLQ